MQKLKNLIKRFIKKDSFFYKVIRKIYNILSTLKYKIVNWKKIKQEDKHYSEQVDKAVEILQKYKGKEYVVFYNPTWLGVAASTKGLFKNYVPLEHIHNKKDGEKLAKAIANNNIKSVIFSQICDGWTNTLEQIKKLNENIKIKVIWHGNCYEFFSD